MWMFTLEKRISRARHMTHVTAIRGWRVRMASYASDDRKSAMAPTTAVIGQTNNAVVSISNHCITIALITF